MNDPQRGLARTWVRISGRVQGVGFRYSALEEARRLGVMGWVRNTHDGAVELVAEGDRAQLQRLVTWCHVGPRGALVTDVEERWLEHRGEFVDFRIKHGGN
jgi:acylphosphatase